MDWTRTAPFYNRQLWLERPALRAAVALADPHCDDELLDLGTGTGGLLGELTHRPEQPCKVIGVDVSTAMLENAPPLPAGWTLQTADARQLPFAANSFDVVTAAYLLHVIDAATLREIIAESRRVLRTGGRLVTVTPALPRTRIARMLYAPLAAAAGSSVGPAAGFRPLDPRQELEEANFTITASRYVGRGYPSLCVLATA